MNNTCDECKHYNLMDGECRRHNTMCRSCGEDCCCDFEIDPLLEKIYEEERGLIKMNDEEKCIAAFIIKNAKETFPFSYSFTGSLTEEQMEEIKKECDIRTMSVYMNGTSWYIIRYRNEVRT